MTLMFVLYFVPMLLWFVCAALCIYKEWYDGRDIALSDILLVVAIGILPLLNIVSFVALCCFVGDTYARHIKIKGRKQ